MCRVPIDARYTQCWGCNQISGQLGGWPLGNVVPISMSASDTQIYSVLKRYKRPFDDTARFELAGLLGLFMQAHRMHTTGGRDHELIAWVPSSEGRHDVHPLRKVLGYFRNADSMLVDALERGPGALGRNDASRDAFAVKPGVDLDGKTVLLLDDLYVTGAHLHSAAAALEDAGAIVVSRVVFARQLVRSWNEHRRVLEWALREAVPWTADTCTCCDMSSMPAELRQ